MIEDRIVAKIAELFYVQDMNQYEIARKFNFSTAKLSRIIKDAKKRGIIEFKIKKFDNRILELEAELEKAYGLKEVIIYHNPNVEDYDEDFLFHEVGMLAAGYLKRVIEDDLNIALAWGKTLHYFVKNVRVDKKCKVNIFSTLGGSNLLTHEYQNNYLVQNLSEKIGGSAYLIYLPLVIENSLEELMKMNNNVEQYIGSTSNIDYYFHGIGVISERARLYPHHGWNKNFIQRLKNKNIVGEIGFNFFDLEGNFIASELEERTIRLNSEQIKKIKNKIAIVSGKEKVLPLKGYLHTGLCDVLITDSKTAVSVLEEK
jgi:DNA-binding transcriptional regulator LsrR (DeoR family)